MMSRPLVVAMIAVVALPAYPIWKPYAKKSKWFLIATNVAQDTIRRVGLSSSQIGQASTMRLSEEDVAGEIQKVRSIYGQYLTYSGWTAASVAGRRIIELGPGLTLGIPALFASDGAEMVVGIDKFVTLQTGADLGVFYSRLRQSLSAPQQAGFDRAMRLQPGIALNADHARYIDHKDVEECVPQLGAERYDLIVSNAVLEEIYDPTPSLRAQGRLLRPGGVMVHRIDLRDYGMFSKRGFHELEFLTVPEWIYQRMAADVGQPNRRLIDYYRNVGKQLGYQTDIYITHVFGAPRDLPEPRRELRAGTDYADWQLKSVREIRPRLIDRFRGLSDADLLTASIVFVARKPATAQ
jgi:SAM-dependent methyltransferase